LPPIPPEVAQFAGMKWIFSSQKQPKYFCIFIFLQTFIFIKGVPLELVSKELNHLAAILHVYAGGLIFISKIFFCYYFSKRKGKYFYTFNHFYSEKSSKRAK
jgi:hypothetical protein